MCTVWEDVRIPCSETNRSLYGPGKSVHTVPGARRGPPSRRRRGEQMALHPHAIHGSSPVTRKGIQAPNGCGRRLPTLKWALWRRKQLPRDVRARTCAGGAFYCPPVQVALHRLPHTFEPVSEGANVKARGQTPGGLGGTSNPCPRVRPQARRGSVAAATHDARPRLALHVRRSGSGVALDAADQVVDLVVLAAVVVQPARDLLHRVQDRRVVPPAELAADRR
jgi:hypothetical protein